MDLVFSVIFLKREINIWFIHTITLLIIFIDPFTVNVMLLFCFVKYNVTKTWNENIIQLSANKIHHQSLSIFPIKTSRLIFIHRTYSIMPKILYLQAQCLNFYQICLSTNKDIASLTSAYQKTPYLIKVQLQVWPARTGSCIYLHVICIKLFFGHNPYEHNT